MSRLTIGTVGLLTVSITPLAVAHTGHPHGAAAETPPPPTPATTATARPSQPLPATTAKAMEHPYGTVVLPAVQLAEQVEFTAIVALADDSPLAQLASPAGLGGLGETLFGLMLGAPLLLYVARDRWQQST